LVLGIINQCLKKQRFYKNYDFEVILISQKIFYR
jgi:hypothetical protein